jgi:hypothetical protein
VASALSVVKDSVFSVVPVVEKRRVFSVIFVPSVVWNFAASVDSAVRIRDV